jgi:hypothetical protein
MKLKELAGKLNRVQHSRAFRIGASVLAALFFLVLDAWRIIDELRDSNSLVQTFDTLGLATLRDFTVSPVASFVYASIAALLLVLLVIWLGQALTYLGLILAAGIVAAFFLPFEPTADIGRFIIAVTILAMAFAILKAGMRLLLSLPWQPLAVARNVLDEAVRAKISVVFIVLLMLGMAFLPNLLDPGQPLRYRIQTFLQWGTGGAYVVLAFLTIFLSISSVAFEQRDRQVWQIITKPIARWKYLLGKWIGVMGLNLVLLGVVGSAIFMFTQYLRQQPAQDQYDRYAVREVVLTARNARDPQYDDPTGQQLVGLLDRKLREYELMDSPMLETAPVETLRDLIREYQRVRQENPERASEVYEELFRYTLIRRLRDEIVEESRTRFRTLSPATQGQLEGRSFVFDGLEHAAERSRSIILRYKVNSGANDPLAQIPLTFILPGLPEPMVQPTALKHLQTIDVPVQAIGPDGTFTVTIINGDIRTGESYAKSINFPPDGLEVMYTVGTFEGNYARAMLVLWVKLGLLAAMGIAAATFMSFPVASLFAFVGLFAAESASFLRESLKYYSTAEKEGFEVFVTIVIRLVGHFVIWLFGPYTELRPTERLVDGRYVSWEQLVLAVLTLGLASALIGLVGIAIFRRRELGTYSGH